MTDTPETPNTPNGPDRPDRPGEQSRPQKRSEPSRPYGPDQPDSPDPPSPSPPLPPSPVNVHKLAMWRWRRNPLRRRSDRLEAWVGLISALVMAVGGTAVGALAYLNVTQNLAQLRYGREPVPAVLIEDAGEKHGVRTRAAVRWTAPNGAVGEGTTEVRVGAKKGTEVTVWLNENGRLSKQPPTPSEASAQGAIAAAILASGVCALVLAGRYSVRRSLDRRRDLAWEFEWAEVGPYWQAGPNGPGK